MSRHILVDHFPEEYCHSLYLVCFQFFIDIGHWYYIDSVDVVSFVAEDSAISTFTILFNFFFVCKLFHLFICLFFLTIKKFMMDLWFLVTFPSNLWYIFSCFLINSNKKNELQIFIVLTNTGWSNFICRESLKISKKEKKIIQ